MYGDKYMKKTLRMGDLFQEEKLMQRLIDIVEWRNLTVVGGYGARAISADETYEWLMREGGKLKDYICDTTRYLEQADKAGKNVLFEAQLGVLRDVDFGIVPYTSSSPTIASYAPIGAGVPFLPLDKTVGIIKAYSSCVGEGPFTAELFGEEGDRLREAGGEYGAATGRPRRVGGFDVVASRYGVKMQGATTLALTKMDVLSYLDKIPVCVAYEIDGKRTNEFPYGEELLRAKPVYEYFDGFHTDISACRSIEELPENAVKYLRYIEKEMGVPVEYLSVGADRDAYIKLF